MLSTTSSFERKDILYTTYIALISFIGFALGSWGIFHIPTYEPMSAFWLLVLLGISAAFVTTTIVIKESGITYQVGSVCALAAIPILGSFAAIIIVLAFNFAVWYIKPAEGNRWRRSWSQLAFNSGMHAIATFGAAQLFWLLDGVVNQHAVLRFIVPWLPAAFVYEQVNLWLLIGVLRLQHGHEIDPIKIWQEDRWATQLSILLLAVGSGTLSFAISQYDVVGGTIFFLPVLLSAYAFRLYSQQIKAYTDDLESIVMERTKDLSELNRQKDAYFAVLTHDMMTPLSSIRYCTEMIRDDATVSEEGIELANLVLRSGQTLFTLVQNILDIERISSGQNLLHELQVLDLNQIVRETTSFITAEAHTKEIEVTQTLADEPLLVRLDPLSMERILLNLLSNALKYTPIGGSISVRTYTQHKSAYLEVADTGYGIDEELIDTIFERNSRAATLRNYAIGTGLGLAITKSLVEGHEGKISLTSKVGKGSTFVVLLPLA